MEYYNEISIVNTKKSNAQRSKESYHRNKIKVAKQRILNAIDKGKCVHKKTLYNPKYNWNSAEQAMMRKCLENRKNRYLINPKDITFIRDKRFRKLYPSDNQKEYHLQQKRELQILENKLAKLKKVFDKIENENVKLVFQDEINNLEEQIKENPIETRPDPIINPDDIPFQTPTPNTENPPSPPRNNTSSPPRNNTSSPPHNNTSSPPRNNTPSSPPRNNTSSPPRNNTSSPPSNREHLITMNDVIKTYRYMIFNDIMYENRNNHSKNKGFKDYKTVIEKFFWLMSQHKFKTNNLLDVYKYPKRYDDITNNKKILQILYKLYTLSHKGKFPSNKISKSVVNLSENINNIKEFMTTYSKFQDKDKKSEEERMRNAPYYDWAEIKRIPSLIKGDSIRELRDMILIRIYVEENVVRDNLGLLRILKTKPSNKVDYNYIYKKQNGRYEIILNDYKNVSFRGSYNIEVHTDLSTLIDTLIQKMNANLKDTSLEYLFSKDDGTPYNEGSLSSYIIRMFKRYTRARGLGINQLRHSVATYYKNESDDFKAELAHKMQHSLTQHKKYERHSNKVIKLPIFNPVKLDKKMIGKRVSVLINEGKYINQRLEGTVYPNKNDMYPHKEDFPYEIRFDIDDEPHEVVSQIPHEGEGITLVK
jgi:hypothetical protein